MMERLTMARIKKIAPKGAADRMAIVVTLKGSAEWKDWVDALADYCRTDVSKLIDQALVELAKSKGFTKEAPRR
jgi:hypothetical protein